MLLNDNQIRELAKAGMIDPFVEDNVRFTDRGAVISYGLTSFGYDLRVGDEFLIFSNLHTTIVDPKKMDAEALVKVRAKDGYILIPPNSFALAESVETFHIPENILGVVYGKSTYARCGIITNVTPLEPGWSGTVTLEISNTTPLPAKIYAGEGLCQVLFMQGERPNRTYADKNGKYQDQKGITLPKV